MPLWAGLLLARPERDVGLGPAREEAAANGWPLWTVFLAAGLALLLGALALLAARLRRP